MPEIYDHETVVRLITEHVEAFTATQTTELFRIKFGTGVELLPHAEVVIRIKEHAADFYKMGGRNF